MFIVSPSFCISTNASMRLFSFHINILTSCLFHLSDDQLLHFPLLSLPFLLLIMCFLHILLHCVHTYAWVTCSSTLSGQPLSSFCSCCCINYQHQEQLLDDLGVMFRPLSQNFNGLPCNTRYELWMGLTLKISLIRLARLTSWRASLAKKNLVFIDGCGHVFCP